MTATSSTVKSNTNSIYKDIHQQITDIIIAQLENGVVPWQKPWTSTESGLPSLPVNRVTGNSYRGINIVLLWCAANAKGYQTNQWASFKQWQKQGESVRKGEKGSLVVYYDTLEKEKDGEIEKIPFLKSSYVFNRSQLNSYEPIAVPDVVNLSEGEAERLEAIDQFVKNTSAIVDHHASGACYIPSKDIIKMPYVEYFKDTTNATATEGYYATLMHELTHWTGAESRINRLKSKKFGDQHYAAEELIAEFGAAFLCSGFGLPSVEKGNHAGYIDHWLKVLNENNRLVIKAASEASKAFDYLHALQPE